MFAEEGLDKLNEEDYVENNNVSNEGGIIENLKSFYYQLEDIYYSLLDEINKYVPIYSIIDPIDQYFPSFILFILVFLILLLLLFYFFIFPSIFHHFTPKYATFIVYDKEDYNPIQGAFIKLTQMSNNLTSEKNTDEFGKAIFQIEDTNVYVNVSKSSYETYSENLTVSTTNENQIYLKKVSQQILKTLTIEVRDAATRELLEGSVSYNFSCQTGSYYAPPNTQGTSSRVISVRTDCRTLIISISAVGYISNSASINLLGDEDKVVIYLTKQNIFGTIGVTVFSAVDNSPLGGITVTLKQLVGSTYVMADTYQKKTDNSGSVIFENLPLGTYYVSAEDVNAYGLYLSANAQDNQVVLTESASIKQINIKLLPLYERKKILLRVVDSNSNEPINNVKVTIFKKISQNIHERLNEPILSNSDGIVEYKNVAPDINYFVLLEHEEYLTKIADVVLVNESSSEAIEIKLTKVDKNEPNFATINVTVEAYGTNQRVEGATVYLYNSNHYIFSTAKITDRNGQVSFINMPPGRYYAKAILVKDSVPYEGTSNTNNVEAGETINLIITLNYQKINFTVTVLEEGTDNPIKDALVKFCESEEGECKVIGEVVLTNSQGKAEKQIPIDKIIYVSVKKDGYAEYISLSYRVIEINNITIRLKKITSDDNILIDEDLVCYVNDAYCDFNPTEDDSGDGDPDNDRDILCKTNMRPISICDMNPNQDSAADQDFNKLNDPDLVCNLAENICVSYPSLTINLSYDNLYKCSSSTDCDLYSIADKIEEGKYYAAKFVTTFIVPANNKMKWDVYSLVIGGLKNQLNASNSRVVIKHVETADLLYYLNGCYDLNNFYRDCSFSTSDLSYKKALIKKDDTIGAVSYEVLIKFYVKNLPPPAGDDKNFEILYGAKAVLDNLEIYYPNTNSLQVFKRVIGTSTGGCPSNCNDTNGKCLCPPICDTGCTLDESGSCMCTSSCTTQQLSRGCFNNSNGVCECTPNCIEGCVYSDGACQCNLGNNKIIYIFTIKDINGFLIDEVSSNSINKIVKLTENTLYYIEYKIWNDTNIDFQNRLLTVRDDSNTFDLNANTLQLDTVLNVNTKEALYPRGIFVGTILFKPVKNNSSTNLKFGLNINRPDANFTLMFNVQPKSKINMILLNPLDCFFLNMGEESKTSYLEVSVSDQTSDSIENATMKIYKKYRNEESVDLTSPLPMDCSSYNNCKTDMNGIWGTWLTVYKDVEYYLVTAEKENYVDGNIKINVCTNDDIIDIIEEDTGEDFNSALELYKKCIDITLNGVSFSSSNNFGVDNFVIDNFSRGKSFSSVITNNCDENILFNVTTVDGSDLDLSIGSEFLLSKGNKKEIKIGTREFLGILPIFIDIKPPTYTTYARLAIIDLYVKDPSTCLKIKDDKFSYTVSENVDAELRIINSCYDGNNSYSKDNLATFNNDYYAEFVNSKNQTLHTILYNYLIKNASVTDIAYVPLSIRDYICASNNQPRCNT